MLALNDRDIAKSVDINELVNAMEESFRIYKSGDYLMPDRMHVNTGDNTLLLMPCFAGNSFSTKLVSVFPGNSSQSLPVIQGTMVLNNGETGEPLALLNGPKLTAMRTAAVGSVAIRYLAPENPEVLGLIGVGMQGLHQALFACSQRPFKKILTYARKKESLDHFKNEFEQLLEEITIIQAESVEQLVNESQVIITSTTSHEPVLPENETLLQNKCFIGVGSFKPTMREFSAALYKSVRQVFVDTEFAVKESGDLAVPLQHGWIEKEQIVLFSDLIAGKVKLEPAASRCFKSVGMALFDLLAAELIYKNARKKGIGTLIEL